MVSLQGGRFVPIPFEDLMDPQTGRMRVRLADIHSTQYAIARRYMIRMRRDDFVDPAIVERLAAACGTDVQQFRSRFEPQTQREPPPLELG
jgi:hypothetical protein